MGVVVGFVLCTFIFELHARIWQTLLVHVLLYVLALVISLIFLQKRSQSEPSTINICQKITRPLVDTRDLFVDLKHNSLLLSFLILLFSLFFYDLFRMGSGSIVYLYLHRLSFDDAHYAAYFTFDQLATCFALIVLALLRRRWIMNDLYLAILGLTLSLVSPILFAFAKDNKAMIFGGRNKQTSQIENVFCSFFSLAIASSMFGTYFSVCIRAIFARLVPERNKGQCSHSSTRMLFSEHFHLGKAFSFIASIQNFDVVVGTIACVEIYQASIDYFPGFVFLFAAATRIVALIFIL